MNEENKQDSVTKDSINKRLSNIEKAIKRIEIYHKDADEAQFRNQLEQFRLTLEQFNFAVKEAEVNIFITLVITAMSVFSIGLAISSMGIAKDDPSLETTGWTVIIMAAALIPIYYLLYYAYRLYKKTTKK